MYQTRDVLVLSKVGSGPHGSEENPGRITLLVMSTDERIECFVMTETERDRSALAVLVTDPNHTIAPAFPGDQNDYLVWVGIPISLDCSEIEYPLSLEYVGQVNQDVHRRVIERQTEVLFGSCSLGKGTEDYYEFEKSLVPPLLKL